MTSREARTRGRQRRACAAETEGTTDNSLARCLHLMRDLDPAGFYPLLFGEWVVRTSSCGTGTIEGVCVRLRGFFQRDPDFYSYLARVF